MKRLRISGLMDEYTDTEFFPTGGSVVDPEVIKERVLAQAAPAKRRMPTLKIVFSVSRPRRSQVLAVDRFKPMASAASCTVWP